MSDENSVHVSQEHKLDLDRHRERKQRQKWHLGEARPTDGHPGKRPNKPISALHRQPFRRELEFQENKTAKMGQINRKYRSCPDTDAYPSDHEEETLDTADRVAPDASYTYSYDRPTGASKGSQILGQAVAQAVERYETKATEKLVRDEYELIANEREGNTTGSSAEEDDFELL